MDALHQLDTTGHFLDAQALASILGTSAKLIYALASRGEIPHYRLGRVVRFSPTEVAAWLRERSCGMRP